MFTEDSTRRFYEDVASLKLKFPGAAIAKATGFSKGVVSMYINKKDEPSENFLNAFYDKFGESLKKVPRGTEQEIAPDNKEGLTMQALVNLTESNKTLADANKTLSESHADLVTMLKGKQVTVSDEDKMLEDVSANLIGIREFLISLGTKVMKTTPEEVAAALGNELVAAKRKIAAHKKDNLADARK